jgi:long-chain acyl-CoA synthetase
MTTAEPRSIPELLKQRVEAAPDKPFLFSETDKRQFTYKEFEAAVQRTARMLSAHGVGKGDVVSLLLPNSVEYVIAYFACWQIGALAGPINSLLKSQETAYVISNSEAKALLVNSEFLPVVETIRYELSSLAAVIKFDNEADATGPHVDGRAQLADIDCDHEAIIIYTSGTTGKPKGCLLTHGNVIANARQISSWLGFTENDNAVVSHERGFSHHDVGTLRRWLERCECEVFGVALLADCLRLSNHFVWLSGDDALDVIEHVSGRRSCRS